MFDVSTAIVSGSDAAGVGTVDGAVDASADLSSWVTTFLGAAIELSSKFGPLATGGSDSSSMALALRFLELPGSESLGSSTTFAPSVLEGPFCRSGIASFPAYHALV